MTAQTHLSEEALNDVLIGFGTSSSEAHLAACAACRGQLEAFRGNVQLFNRASLAWSEARSATMPHPAPSRHVLFAPLGWALATMLLLTIGIPVWKFEHRSSPNTVSVAAQNSNASPIAASNDSETQIAEDNHLLREVNEALNVNEASPFAEYRLAEGPRSHRKARIELRNR
jgi:hypothetical protein